MLGQRCRELLARVLGARGLLARVRGVRGLLARVLAARGLLVSAQHLAGGRDRGVQKAVVSPGVLVFILNPGDGSIVLIVVSLLSLLSALLLYYLLIPWLI